MTACAAKVFNNSTCTGKRARFRATYRQGADRIAVADQRHGQRTAETAFDCGIADFVLGVVKDIRNRNDLPGQQCSARTGLAIGRPRECLPDGRVVFRRDVSDGCKMNQLGVVEHEDICRVCDAQLHRSGDDGVENRLNVGGRGTDDAQDLAGRRLLLQRLGQVAVAVFQFLEEADVLDRDHRLVGERFHQLDLLVGEWLDARFPGDDDADHRPVAQHRHGEDRPVAQQLLRVRARVLG